MEAEFEGESEGRLLNFVLRFGLAKWILEQGIVVWTSINIINYMRKISGLTLFSLSNSIETRL